MISETRRTIYETMQEYSKALNLKNKMILEVGIAGDPEYKNGKRGGNYKYFGKGNSYFTLDVLDKYNPDYVEDICRTDFPNNTWDLIILSQTLEHIFTPMKALEECKRILKTDGYLIVDTPWNYPQHDTEDTGDFYRFTPMFYKAIAEKLDFKIVIEHTFPYLNSVLYKK